MRRKLVLLLIMISVVGLLSCSGSNGNKRHTNYADGSVHEEWQVRKQEDGSVVRHGDFIAYFESGVVESEGVYTNGKKTGQWTYWYDTDPQVRRMEGAFVDGEMDGQWLRWMHHGHHASATGGDSMSHMMMDSTEMESEFVHPEPHKMEQYDNGIPNGMWRSTYHDGSTADSFAYIDGQLTGEVVSYHPNGLRASLVVYDSGQVVGDILMWDDSGKRIGDTLR